MSTKPALIISHRCHAVFAEELTAAVARLKLPHDVVALPVDKDARLSEADVARGEIAFYSQDLNPAHGRQFFSAVRKGPNMKWIHVFNIGVDHPIYTEMLERGVKVTTSAGTTAMPISQTALTGMLMLSRGFPFWMKSQAEHRWQQVRLQDSPEIDVVAIESGAALGGLGEPATPPIAAAVANAAYILTGQRVRELPMKNYRFTAVPTERV